MIPITSHTPNVKRKHVGISLLYYSPHRLSGAGTYIVGITRGLLARQVHDYSVFVSKPHERLWRELLSPFSRFIVCGPEPDHRVRRVLYEQYRLPVVALRHSVEALFLPHAFSPRWRTPRPIVTVYDLLLFARGTDFPWYKRLYHRWMYSTLASRAATIVTISEFCRRDISVKLGVEPRRITVAPPGIDEEFLATTPSSFARPNHEMPERYLLSVAGSYQHKRLDVLLEAFAIVSRDDQDLHLVMAGTHVGDQNNLAKLRAQVNTRGLSMKVHFLPRLPREEVPYLFLRASALASSSSFEGFGIPVLEAMAAGCPVAASPAEAVVEVLGGYGWVAHDWTPVALADVIQIALNARVADPDRLENAKNRGSDTYTWGAAAGALEEAFATE